MGQEFDLLNFGAVLIHLGRHLLGGDLHLGGLSCLGGDALLGGVSSLGGDLHLRGLSCLGGDLILHVGGTSLPRWPLSGELSGLSLTTWRTLIGDGVLLSGEGAGHLRLPTVLLFGDDSLAVARLRGLAPGGDLLLSTGQGSALALSWLDPQADSGDTDFSRLSFFAFFFLAPFLPMVGEHCDAAVA